MLWAYKKFLVRLWRAYWPDESLPGQQRHGRNNIGPRQAVLDLPGDHLRPDDNGRDDDELGEEEREGEDFEQEDFAQEYFEQEQPEEDGGLDDDEEEEGDELDEIEVLLREHGVADERALWSTFDQNPEYFVHRLPDESVFAALVSGYLGFGTYSGWGVESRQAEDLQRAAKSAIDRGCPVTSTYWFEVFEARMSTGHQGEITVTNFPSLEQLERGDYQYDDEEDPETQWYSRNFDSSNRDGSVEYEVFGESVEHEFDSSEADGDEDEDSDPALFVSQDESAADHDPEDAQFDQYEDHIYADQDFDEQEADGSSYDEDLTDQADRVDSCEPASEYTDECQYDGSQVIEDDTEGRFHDSDMSDAGLNEGSAHTVPWSGLQYSEDDFDEDKE